MCVWLMGDSLLPLSFCLQFTVKVVEEEVETKKKNTPKRLCTIWDNTIHVETSAPCNKCPALMCTAVKYTNGSLQFGTKLVSVRNDVVHTEEGSVCVRERG